MRAMKAGEISCSSITPARAGCCRLASRRTSSARSLPDPTADADGDWAVVDIEPERSRYKVQVSLDTIRRR